MADQKNNVRKLRESQLMSKAELARKAGLSPLTIDRVEAGKPSRMDTKRKIILALGLKLTDRHKVFPEDAGAEAAAPSTNDEGEGRARSETGGRRKRVRRRRGGRAAASETETAGDSGSAETASGAPSNGGTGRPETHGDPASNDDGERKAIAGGGVQTPRLEAPGRGGKLRFR
jgi:transcriptional regulator with XRE-family HTH domain